MIERNKNKAYDKIILTIPIIYIVTVSAYMVWHRAWFAPDQFFAFAILAVIALGRTKQFLWDWIPVLLLLFGYEYLRGIVPHLTKNPHIWPMIRGDYFLFGYLPTIRLQSTLFHASSLHWYDYTAVVLYISHFIIPMVVAFTFWLYDRKIFKQFMTAFLLLSYFGFFTYIIFPAMPPWMASNLGYIPPLDKIMDTVMTSFSHPISVPSVYQFFGANLVAAVPSLHAAYPWLIFLYAVKKLGKIGFLTFPYVLGVWFAVVYLGEHYVVDVIVGVTYASVAYLTITYLEKRKLNYALKGGELTS